MALKIGELFATLNLATGDFNKGLKGAQALFKKAGLAIADMGLGAAESMVNIGKSFESAMSDVQAISGATGDELKKLRDTAKEYGSSTAFTATESAEALKYMALAGWDANQSVEALPGVLDMAAASGMDLAAASDAVTDYISAFGLEAKDATYMADAMAKAQATANTSAQQLAEAWGNSASAMHSAGQDMETTTAALMVFADQGLKGSEAGTALTAIMRDITQKMENGKIMIGKTAVSVMDANGNFRDLNDIMRDVEAATQGMGDAQAQAALQSTFTARSIQGVNKLLTAGITQFDDYENAVRGSAGTAAEQAEVMLDNLSGDIKLFQSALEGVQIDMYESANGILRDAVQGATDIITAFQEVVKSGFATDAMQEMFVTAFDFIGNIGTKAIDGLITGLESFSRIIPTISRSINAGLKNIITVAGKRLPKLLKNLMKPLPGIMKGLLNDVLPELIPVAFDIVSELGENVVRMLPELIPILVKGILNLIPGVLQGIGKVWQSFGKSIANMFGVGFDSEDMLDAFLGNIDQDYVADFRGQIDGEFEYGPVITAAEEAIAAVQQALSGLGLDESVAAAIEEAVRSGSGVELFEATLVSLGVDQDAAGKVAEDIKAAMGKINGALVGLKLSDEAEEAIRNLISEGGTKEEIQAALEGYDVDPKVAERVATDITKARTRINEELIQLGIDPGTAAALSNGASADKALIAECLNALGLPPGVVETILASYDTVASDISGRITGVFQKVYDTLTDGKTDTADIMEELETEVRNVYADAVKQINTWRDEELAKLDSSSASYETDSQAIIDKANAMTDQLGVQEQAALSFLTSMANQSTEIVMQNKDQLDQILADTKAIVEEINQMTESTSLEAKAFEVVTSGASTSARTVGQAFDFASASYKKVLMEAQEKYEAEIDELTGKGLSSRAKADEWQAVKDQARAAYEAQMAAIFQGIASATIDPKDLANIQGMVEDYNLFGDVYEWILSGSDRAELPSGFNDVFSDFVADLAQKMGLDGVTEDFYQTVKETLLSGEGYGAEFSAYVDTLYGEATDALTNAFANGEFDTTTLANAVESAIESGLFEGTSFEDLDTSNIIELFSMIFGTPIDVPAPEIEVDEAGIQENAQEAVDEAAEVAAEAVEGATQSTPVGSTSVMTVEPTVEVGDVEVQTGSESSIQEATEAYLAEQNMQIPINASVSLSVSVADSNAATVGTTAGVTLGQALASGIRSTMADASSAAGALVNAAFGAMSTRTSLAKSSGMYFATGFASGIRSGKNSVATAARELAQSAVNALKAGIKQGSPSKITMESGAFFGEGFGIGILKELRFVRGAAESIAGTAINSLGLLRAPQPAFAAELSLAGDSISQRSGGASGGLLGALGAIAKQARPEPIDYDRLADAMNQRKMALYQDGREVADISARDNARAQNNLKRRTNLSVGKRG